jgi:galactokinase/mevalonate kinase-like predicted kinase
MLMAQNRSFYGGVSRSKTDVYGDRKSKVTNRQTESVGQMEEHLNLNENLWQFLSTAW